MSCTRGHKDTSMKESGGPHFRFRGIGEEPPVAGWRCEGCTGASSSAKKRKKAQSMARPEAAPGVVLPEGVSNADHVDRDEAHSTMAVKKAVKAANLSLKAQVSELSI